MRRVLLFCFKYLFFRVTVDVIPATMKVKSIALRVGQMKPLMMMQTDVRYHNVMQTVKMVFVQAPISVPVKLVGKNFRQYIYQL